MPKSPALRRFLAEAAAPGSDGGADVRTIAEDDDPRAALRGALEERLRRVIDRAFESITTSSVRRALDEPTDFSALAVFLADSAGAQPGLAELDPLAEAMAKSAGRRVELLEQAGGAWSTAQVAKAIGSSRQAIDKRRRRGTLLALPTPSGDYVYPTCQFAKDGRSLPGLQRVLAAFREPDPWTQLSVLAAPHDALDGRTPLEAIAEGDVDEAVAVAEGFGETGG